MLKLLIPIDFSESSTASLRLGFDLAQKIRAEIHVIHCYAPSFLEPYMPLALEHALKKAREKEAMEVLQSWLEEQDLRTPQYTPISYHLLRGKARSLILSYAKNWMADLIIMGTGQTYQIGSLGSTAKHILSDGEIPLMMIPSGWNLSQIRSMLYATHTLEEDVQAISRVMDLAELYQAKVACIQMNPVSHGTYQLEILKQAFKQEVEDGKLGFRRVEEEDMVNGLLAVLENQQVDLLAMCKHQKSLWDKWFGEDNIEKLRKYTPIPIWIISHLTLGKDLHEIKSWNFRRPFAI